MSENVFRHDIWQCVSFFFSWDKKNGTLSFRLVVFPIPHPALGHIKHGSRCTNSIMSSATSLGGRRRYLLIVGPLMRRWLAHPSQQPIVSTIWEAERGVFFFFFFSLLLETQMCHTFLHLNPHSVTTGLFKSLKNLTEGEQQQMDGAFFFREPPHRRKQCIVGYAENHVKKWTKAKQRQNECLWIPVVFLSSFLKWILKHWEKA